MCCVGTEFSPVTLEELTKDLVDHVLTVNTRERGFTPFVIPQMTKDTFRPLEDTFPPYTVPSAGATWLDEAHTALETQEDNSLRFAFVITDLQRASREPMGIEDQEVFFGEIDPMEDDRWRIKPFRHLGTTDLTSSHETTGSLGLSYPIRNDDGTYALRGPSFRLGIFSAMLHDFISEHTMEVDIQVKAVPELTPAQKDQQGVLSGLYSDVQRRHARTEDDEDLANVMEGMDMD